MKKRKIGVVPTFRPDGHPNWFHEKGTSMQIICFDKKEKKLSIGSKTARLVVQAFGDQFQVNWEIFHGSGAHVEGYTMMTRKEIRAAFCGRYTESGPKLVVRFGGETASPGKFIRWEQYLNIPGPGTGIWGDPNVSVELSKKIAQAIRRVMKK